MVERELKVTVEFGTDGGGRPGLSSRWPGRSTSRRHRSSRISWPPLLDQGQGSVVVDLGEVTFLDSTGLSALIGGLKRCQAAGGDSGSSPPTERAEGSRSHRADRTFQVEEAEAADGVGGLSSKTASLREGRAERGEPMSNERSEVSEATRQAEAEEARVAHDAGATEAEAAESADGAPGRRGRAGPLPGDDRAGGQRTRRRSDPLSDGGRSPGRPAGPALPSDLGERLSRAGTTTTPMTIDRGGARTRAGTAARRVMSVAGGGRRRPETDGDFRHEAFFYRRRHEFVDGAAAFLAAAVAAGQPALVVVSRRKIDLLRKQLGRAGATVMFADMDDVGTNPARIIPAWTDFVADHEDAAARYRGADLGRTEPGRIGRVPAARVSAQRRLRRQGRIHA